ncbi:MAG: O-antigen ligase family protein [Bacteroidales bacterium]|nr:O-antigen ligase family protein [Bacteroidales bacterium]
MIEKLGKYLFILLCASIFVGGYFYIHFTFLTGIRILTLCSIIYYLCLPAQKKSPLYYATLLFFLFYTCYTSCISLFYPYELTIGTYFNFLSIPFLLFALMGPACSSPQNHLKYFYHFCYAALVIFFFFGAIEYFTDSHLYGSALILPTTEFINKHSISIFSHNPNDFATILTLTLLFFLSYRKIFLAHKKWIIDVVFTLLAILLIFISGCRTALCILFLYFIFYFRKFFKQYRWVSYISIFLMLLGMLFYFAYFMDESIITRWHLYQYAFISLFDSYGLGMGIKGDIYYLSQLQNVDLFLFITDSHSYLFQMLFTSGIFCSLAYLLLIIKMERVMAQGGRNEFWILPILYLLILFAPSSSLFLWSHYLFFAMFVCYAEYIHQKINPLSVCSQQHAE